MPKSNPFQPSFNAGELSPRLAARTDFGKYPSGLETCLNAIPLPEGGLTRRPGTRFVVELKSSSVKGRIKRFEFSTTQAYILEFGEKIMRFCRHQGQIVSGDTDASITNGTFTSNITSWTDVSTGSGSITHDSTNGRLSLVPGGTGSSDIGWAEQAVTVGAAFDTNEHVLKFRVLGAPSDKIELSIGTGSTGVQIVDTVEFEVGYHGYAFTPGDGNNTIYIQFRNLGSFRNKTVQIDDVSLIDNDAMEIDTPWAEAELFFVNGPQSADTMYLYHPDHSTYKLLRLGHTRWSLSEVAWQDGPYLTQNTTTTTLTPSAATGLGVDVTASSVVGINDDRGFLATDVGRLIRITDNTTTNWGWGIIVSVTSTTVVKVDIRRTFTITTAELEWRLGAWSSTTGYPSLGAFYEQRQFAANTATQPQTFWATQTADFENLAPDSPNADGTTFAGTVEDDDALNYTIAADEVETIRWMSPGEDTLAMGATSGEWIPDSTGVFLTPTDLVARRRTKHGSANIQPVRVGNVVLFVQRAKRKIREFGFAFEVDGFRAPDMTRLAQHVTLSTIVEMTYQQEPDSLVWAVRSDGNLISMTYRREEDVVGWARHNIGGKGTGATQVSFSITAGTASVGTNQITSITINGVEFLGGAVDWETSNAATAVNVALSFNSLSSVPTTWAQVGNGLTITSGGGGGGENLAGMTSSRVAYADNIDDDLRAYDFDGTDWAQVGNALVIDAASSTTPAIGGLSSTRIAYIKEGVNELRAYDFDGVNWTQAGNSLDLGISNNWSLDTLSSNRVVLFELGGDNLETFEFDGTDWAQVGNTLNLPSVSGHDLAALSSSRVAIAISGTPGSITTYDFDGTDWEQVGNPLSITTVGAHTICTLSSSLIAFADKNNDELRVYQFNGTDWSEVGTALAIADFDTVGQAMGQMTNTRIAFHHRGDHKLRAYDLSFSTAASWTATASGSTVTLSLADNSVDGQSVVVTTAGDVRVDNGSVATLTLTSTGIPISESVVTIPGANGSGQVQDSTDRDEVWVIVTRTINSQTKRYIEVFERDFEDGDDEEDSYYADSIITFDGDPTTTITGLSHLEGETVKILADGYIHADKVVSSGAITLDRTASVVQIGLPYTHTIKPLKFEGGTALGTAVGKLKQITGVTFVLLNSHTLGFGPDADNLRTIDFREITDPMDTAVPLFTGERFEVFDANWKEDPRIIVQSDDPTPFTLLALAPEIDIRESRG